jgi:hypothetical protein
MEHLDIFSATLGLSPPWHIVSVAFAREESRVDISVDFYPGNLFTCPHCGQQRSPLFSKEELWFHEDFFRYAAYLDARVPRIECCQGVFTVERPWSRAGSRFGRLLPGTDPSDPCEAAAQASLLSGADQQGGEKRPLS